MSIRLMLVDDHEMVRRGLIVLLSDYDDVDIVAQAKDGAFAVQICRQIVPDVVLMDIYMPGMDGVEATRLIRTLCPQTQVIVLTASGTEAELRDMLSAGAIGFLVKTVTGDELVEAIRNAHHRRPVVSPEVAHVLIQMHNRDTDPSRLKLKQLLTERELDILKAMTTGMSNREIAALLGISYSTVKNHVSTIIHKLGVRTRSQAVALAIEHGITKASHR